MSLAQFRTAFSPKFQDILTKSLIGFKIANTRFESELTWGTTVSRNILDMSGSQVRDVTRYSDRTINELSDSAETIVVNKQKACDFKLDSWDALQQKALSVGENAGKQTALKLRRYIDADIFNETLNGFAVFGDGDIGGTLGNAITLSTSNFGQVISDLQAKLISNNIDENGDLALVIDPYAASIINQTLLGKNIALTDLTLKNGYAGPVLGFKTYISNNLTFTGILELAVVPVATNTVTINGVVFTFVAAVGATAGNVLIGANAAAAQANLISAVNGSAGAGTTYVELSAANRAKLTDSRVVATSVGTTMVIKAIGAGRISCTESITDAGDVWSKKMIHCFAGKTKTIDVIIQQDVMPEPRKEPKQKTVNMLTDALYGLKTFADGAAQFLDLQVAVA
jgi:hypothetical protein